MAAPVQSSLERRIRSVAYLKEVFTGSRLWVSVASLGKDSESCIDETQSAPAFQPQCLSAATAPYDSTYLRMVTMLKITFITCCPMRECIGRSASPLRSHTSAMPPRCSRHIRPRSQRCVGSTSECRWRRCYSGPLVCPSCARYCSCRRSVSTTSENLPRTRRPSEHEAPPVSRG